MEAAPGKGRKRPNRKQLLEPGNRKQKPQSQRRHSASLLKTPDFNKSAPELKTGIRDIFAKNDLAVVGVKTGVSRKFGYVDFESAADLEKALELTGLNVFGNEIKLEENKGKDRKRLRCRTILAKNVAL